MLLRRAARAALVAVLVMAGCGACGGSDDGRPAAPGSKDPGAALPANVEPQVLQDVIAGAFEIAGPEMGRAIRLLQFLRNQGIEECGGEPGPSDGTYNREDQSRFPDLALIRSKGFTEQDAVEEEDARLEDLSADCTDLTPDLPHYEAWRQAQDSWYEQVVTAEQSAPVQDQKPALARCLTQRSGTAVAVADPVNDFLQRVNTENIDGASDARLAELAEAYADCAADYFSAFRTELLKARPAFVDRNREALDDFAAEVVAAGYVP